MDAKAVVLATGAYDRVLPFPGWDLPGVYSAGAAQALAKGQRIAVGKRVLVAGTGPFLLPVAESLIGVGAEVVALLEANSPDDGPEGLVHRPVSCPEQASRGGSGTARCSPATASRFKSRLDRYRRPRRPTTSRPSPSRVSTTTGTRSQAPNVTSRSTRSAWASASPPNWSWQSRPAANSTTGPDGGPAVVVDANQQTTTPGVFAAGELTGIGGAALAAAEGRVAGAAAARHAQSAEQPAAAAPTGDPTSTTQSRNLLDPAAAAASATVGSGSAEEEAARADVAKGRRFAEALAKAYPVREGWRSWSRRETVVCRCEEVTRGEIEGAVAERGVADGRGSEAQQSRRARALSGTGLFPHCRRVGRRTRRRTRSKHETTDRRACPACGIWLRLRRSCEREVGRRDRRHRAAVRRGCVGAGGVAARSGQVRRALPLAGRQRLPWRRAERLAGGVLVAHRRRASGGRADRDRGRRRRRCRGRRRPRRRRAPGPRAGPRRRPRTARTAYCACRRPCTGRTAAR